MTFRNFPTALNVELKTCNTVLVRTFHKASKIMTAKTISMIITAIIMHICVKQSKTYFTAFRAGVFCVMSMQVSYPDISLVYGEDPCVCGVLAEFLPQHKQSVRLIRSSRLDAGSLRALFGQRTIEKSCWVSNRIFDTKHSIYRAGVRRGRHILTTTETMYRYA